MNREKLKEDLKSVILSTLRRLNITPTDRHSVMAASSQIWDDLIKSGLLPPGLREHHMLEGMSRAAVEAELNEIFETIGGFTR